MEMQCHDTDVPVIRYNFVNLSGLPDLQKEAICGMLLTFIALSRSLPVNGRRHWRREGSRGFGRDHHKKQ